MRNWMKFFVLCGVIVEASHAFALNTEECKAQLNANANFHKNWERNNIGLSLTVIGAPFGIPQIFRHKLMAKKFKRAWSLLEEASWTDREFLLLADVTKALHLELVKYRQIPSPLHVRDALLKMDLCKHYDLPGASYATYRKALKWVSLQSQTLDFFDTEAGQEVLRKNYSATLNSSTGA